MSIASALGTSAYFIAIAACSLGWRAARRGVRPPIERRTFVGAICFFAALATIRFWSLEEAARDALRDLFRADGIYQDRWTFQAPLVAFSLIVTAGLAFYIFRRRRIYIRSYRGTLAYLMRVAMIAFVPLIAMRTISLHAMDRVLYGGPVRLNWIVDGGLTMAVIACSIAYVLHRPSPNPSARR